jgi:endonuclease IV
MYKKMVIENKPLVGWREERCLGASPEEIRSLLAATHRGFCLDFGHAICYSVAAKKDWKSVLDEFLTLKPSMYHLCDGFYKPKDAHEHLGEGEFDLPYLTKLIDPNKNVSLETKKNSQDSLDDFIGDVNRLREYAGIQNKR